MAALPHPATTLGAIGAALCLATAGCQASPVHAASRPVGMGFRLVVETGTAEVSGVVRAPATLLGPAGSPLAREQGAARLDETPVAGAAVRALDREGRILDRVAPVRTDARGRFTLRGARLGEPMFVEARFASASGSERALSAYVRPEAAAACAAITLGSTIVASEIGRLGARFPSFSGEGIGEAIALIERRLPDLLEAAGGEAAGDPGAHVQRLLEEVAQPVSPGAPAPALVSEALAQVPAARAAVMKAAETFLEVSFAIRAFGTNDAPVVREDRIRHLLIGRVELVARTASPEDAAVSFWLNNDRIAEGTPTEEGFSAQLDTRGFPDGPYVLTAMSGKGAARSFVYLKNATPVGPMACEEGDVR